MPKAAHKSKPVPREVPIQRVEPLFHFFAFLVSLREELLMRSQQKLPRYCERDCNGGLSFRVDQGARVPLPSDPATAEFRTAYRVALCDAIAAEDDSDDWSELERFHAEQAGRALR